MNNIFKIREIKNKQQYVKVKRLCFGINLLGLFLFIFGTMMALWGVFTLLSNLMRIKYSDIGIAVLVIGLIMIVISAPVILIRLRLRKSLRIFGNKSTVKREGE